VGPTTIYSPLCQTSRINYRSSGHPFFDPSSAMGSGSHPLHSHIPQVTIHPWPRRMHFYHILPRYTCLYSQFLNNLLYVLYLQILFTSGIQFLCVQVLGHHASTYPLQVYDRHWHVIIPSEYQLHLPVTPSDICL
jgi:hypothetical protein